jgi:predicted nucleic acid-binding protein
MRTEQQDPLARNRAVILDTFAWIEYFNGTSAGEKVRGVLETGLVVTPAIVVAELSEKHRRLNREFGPKYDFVKARELNFERKKKVKGWGMADSIILATARRAGSRIVTGDPHFRDLTEETIML